MNNKVAEAFKRNGTGRRLLIDTRRENSLEIVCQAHSDFSTTIT